MMAVERTFALGECPSRGSKRAKRAMKEPVEEPWS
jgi:hypothetical protein